MASKFSEQNEAMRQEQLKKAAAEAAARAIEECMRPYKEAVARLRQELAEERQRNAELTARVDHLSEIFDVLMPQAHQMLVERLRSFDTKRRDDAAELRYRKLFSGDGGILYRLADLIAYAHNVAAEPSAKDIRHYFSAFLVPFGNALIAIEGNAEPVADNFDSLSTDELIQQIRAEEATPSRLQLREGFERFYSGVWEAAGPILRQLADERRQDELEAMAPAEAQRVLRQAVDSLAKAVEGAGVDICYAPDARTADLFKSADADTPAKPLIMRHNDGYIYSYGIKNDK